MEYSEFKEIFNEECKKNNISNVVNVDKFYKYMNLLLEWNEKINLTAIKDEKEFIVKHFIDSITINELVKDKKRIIDVGTGAGFPGIPLKLLNDKQNITLIDSVNKKVNVLNNIITELNLENIEALHVRAEDLSKNENYREKFDVAVSRAVANMTTLVEYLIPFVKVGGFVICMKGPNFEEELENSKKAINILGGKVDLVESFNIDEDLERNIIKIKKIKSTPNKYPRGQGKPLKEPLN
jgi:16S rRNA (guanine527-N7)-methyltransferase